MENAHIEADKAEGDSQKLQRQAEKLTHDVKTAKDEIAALEAQKTASEAEVAFLANYVKAAETNRASLATRF